MNLGNGHSWNRGGESREVALEVPGFHFYQDSYSVMKQSSFSINFHIANIFNLDYVIHFYKPKKGILYQDFSGRNVWLLLGR